jgi:hypothetical protein
MGRIMRILPVVLMCGGIAVTRAQVAEFSFGAGQSILRNSTLIATTTEDGTPVEVKLKDGFRFGFRITLNNWRFLGHEFGYGYNRSQLTLPDGDRGMAIHQGFYNLLAYALPEGSKIRPFVTGGAHFSNFVPPGRSATSGGGDNNSICASTTHRSPTSSSPRPRAGSARSRFRRGLRWRSEPLAEVWQLVEKATWQVWRLTPRGRKSLTHRVG